MDILPKTRVFIVSENESTMSLNKVEPELNEENESTMSLNKVEPEPSEENESNKKCGNIFDKMLLKIWEKIFFYALAQSDNTFPGHVCCTFLNSVAAIPRFNAFREKAMGFLPTLYGNYHTVFPKDKRVPGETHVNVKQLSKFFGVHSSVMACFISRSV